MKKQLATVCVIVWIMTSLFSFSASAKSADQICSYVSFNGEKIEYYKDTDGGTYVIEDGKKEYIAVPVSVEKITDSAELSQLRAIAGSRTLSVASVASATLPYSKTMNFSSTIDTTSILNVSSATYYYLKCSSLNPSGAKRGFSYYVRFSPDGTTWYRELYVCQSLLLYTRHRMADLGNAPYIQIQMWSYYGTVSSCLLSMK